MESSRDGGGGLENSRDKTNGLAKKIIKNLSQIDPNEKGRVFVFSKESLSSWGF